MKFLQNFIKIKKKGMEMKRKSYLILIALIVLSFSCSTAPKKGMTTCEDSIPLLEKKIKANPADAESYYYYGYCLGETGKYEESADALTKAEQLGFDKKAVNEYKIRFWGVNNRKGVLNLKKGENKKAVNLFKTAIYIYPEKEETYFNLAQAYENEENFKKAAETLEILYKDNKLTEKLYISLAKLYVRLNSYAKAAQILQEGKQTFKESQKIEESYKKLILQLNIE